MACGTGKSIFLIPQGHGCGTILVDVHHFQQTYGHYQNVDKRLCFALDINLDTQKPKD